MIPPALKVRAIWPTRGRPRIRARPTTRRVYRMTSLAVFAIAVAFIFFSPFY